MLDKDLEQMGFSEDFDLGGEAADIEALFGGGDTSDSTPTVPTVQEEITVSKTANEDKPEEKVIEPPIIAEEQEVKEEKTVEIQIGISEKSDAETDTQQKTEEPDLFAEAIAKAENKQAESTKNSLAEKLPVFSYANATEEIADPSITFDKLRNDKAEDFPELDDGTSVTWKMVYGTITKSITAPKKTTILEMKKKIEGSKEFTEALKKAKDEPVCKVQPSVTAKKKGRAVSYKGIFDSVDAAMQSNVAIGYVPSDDGNVYEVRNTKTGTFIAKAEKVSILPKVRVGFIPALPKIPHSVLSQILSFFKSYVTEERQLEVMAYIYWSIKEEEYRVYIPHQKVTKQSVDTVMAEFDEDEYLLVIGTC